MNLFQKTLLLLLLAVLSSCASYSGKNETAAKKLIRTATESDFAYQRLAKLCDTFGPRFSGSTNLEAAIDWILAEMKRDGLENVHAEDVMVPHWVRGQESAELIAPIARPLHMLGLGGSIGTPPEGITAEVLVVTNFSDLKAHSADARGKIVLFNEPFSTYDHTVKIRKFGAIEAARVGAVAGLIRSVTPVSLQTPHTGNMKYTNDVEKIPHAALSVEDAELLQRMQNRGEKIVVRLRMSAETLPDVLSRNVIGEIVGREKPDEIILVSGHIDSWDVGTGAMDDAGGCIAAWEAVRLMHKLGLRPRRTVRVVLWVNEENGVAGARTYARAHSGELSKHILAIESDQGVFKPNGFGFTGPKEAMNILRKFCRLLKPIEADKLISGGGDEADISELHTAGMPMMSLLVDGSKYFWYHHTEADRPDKLSADEVNRCVAALAVMSFAVSDLP